MGGRERGERGGLGQLEEAAAAAVTDFNIPTSFLSLSLSPVRRRRLLLTWGNK